MCLEVNRCPHLRLCCSVTVSVLGKTERYEIEQEFEFTSDRKRMSVVARSLDTGVYVFPMQPSFPLP